MQLPEDGQITPCGKKRMVWLIKEADNVLSVPLLESLSSHCHLTIDSTFTLASERLSGQFKSFTTVRSVSEVIFEASKQVITRYFRLNDAKLHTVQRLRISRGRRGRTSRGMRVFGITLGMKTQERRLAEGQTTGKRIDGMEPFSTSTKWKI